MNGNNFGIALLILMFWVVYSNISNSKDETPPTAEQIAATQNLFAKLRSIPPRSLLLTKEGDVFLIRRCEPNENACHVQLEVNQGDAILLLEKEVYQLNITEAISTQDSRYPELAAKFLQQL